MAKILLVDDDAVLLYDLSRKLKSWGHDVVLAANGRSGYSAMQKSEFEIVISDVNMPIESGFDLAKKIRGPGLRHIDVSLLLLSSDSRSHAVTYGIDCGADDYITKPIDHKILELKINAQIKKRASMIRRLVINPFAKSTTGAMLNCILVVFVMTFISIVILLLIYWLKIAVGTSLMENIHLRNFF
jgi:DNA-binding response OmpR family regulator